MTKQEYYKALKEGSVEPLTELAKNAGYVPVDMKRLSGFKEAYDEAQKIEEKFIETGEGVRVIKYLCLGGLPRLANGLNYLKNFNEGMFAINNERNEYVAIGKTNYPAGVPWDAHTHNLTELESPRILLCTGKLKDKLENTELLYDELLEIDVNEDHRSENAGYLGIIPPAILALPMGGLTDNITLTFGAIGVGTAISLWANSRIGSQYGKSAVKKLYRGARGNKDSELEGELKEGRW